MKIKSMFIILCGIAVLQAGVLASPSWRTSPAGQAPTTYQEWTFDSYASSDIYTTNPAGITAIGILADVDNNGYGDPTANITVTPGANTTSAGWFDSYGGKNGVWAGDVATVTLNLPNNPVTNTYKEIWVEVSCRGHLLGGTAEDLAGFALGTGYTVLGVDLASVEDLGYTFVNYTSGWRKLIFGLRIYPNPSEESIQFTLLDSGAYVNSIIVDTICIPEPATMTLLGLGGLMSLIRRKR